MIALYVALRAYDIGLREQLRMLRSVVTEGLRSPLRFIVPQFSETVGPAVRSCAGRDALTLMTRIADQRLTAMDYRPGSTAVAGTGRRLLRVISHQIRARSESPESAER